MELKSWIITLLTSGRIYALVLAQQRKLFPQSELWLLGVQPFLATCDMKLACDFSALSFIAIRKIIFFMLKTLLNFKA